MNMTGLELLKHRKSVRSFASSPISVEVRNRLRSEATYVNSHEAGLNFHVCFDDDAPFRGVGRSYGMFRNVSDYLAVVIDPTFPDTYERAGYFAEQWVMEAVKSGLGTCFVGGTFSASHIAARMEVYEKLPFVVAFGIPEESKTTLIAKLGMKIAHRKHRPARFFYDGDDAEYERARRAIGWLDCALESVACAPSSLNKQPVRLKMTEVNGVATVEAHTVEPGKAPVDLGIAKFNVACAVQGTWEWGEKGIFMPD